MPHSASPHSHSQKLARNYSPPQADRTRLTGPLLVDGSLRQFQFRTKPAGELRCAATTEQAFFTCFDHPTPLSPADLISVMALATRTGLGSVVDYWVELPEYFHANASDVGVGHCMPAPCQTIFAIGKCRSLTVSSDSRTYVRIKPVGMTAMPCKIDANVDVILADNGDPTAFIWDRFEHTVIGQPQAIFTRRSWWETAAIPTLIDAELWRLDASRGGAVQHRYDLRRDADGSWVLAVDWG